MPDNTIRFPYAQVGPPIRLYLCACTSHHASLELIPDPFQYRTGASFSEDANLSGIQTDRDSLLRSSSLPQEASQQFVTQS